MSDHEMIPEKTSTEFIEEVVSQIKGGFGITPYTGAGVSARSGIMVGADFTNYLSWVIYRCLGAHWLPDASDGKADQSSSSKGKWVTDQLYAHRIRVDGWPNRPKQKEVDAVTEWARRTFIETAKKHGANIHRSVSDQLTETEGESPRGERGPGHLIWGRPLIPSILYRAAEARLQSQDEAIKRLLRDRGVFSYQENLSDPRLRSDSQTGLQEVALRSLHDWRAMLDFLARISSRNGKLVLVDRDEGVIDSFNQHFTRGRKPNLTHTMLAHLLGPMRTRLLITTNFDSLHEEAFRASGIPFEVRDVTKAQGLPAVETVRAGTSIIKLHGSHTGTRADFSLDQPPEAGENEKFFKWITGQSCSGVDDRKWLPSHLLVIGASGEDTRCLHFIKYLLDFSSETKIFWVCFNGRELGKVREFFAEREYQKRLIVTVTDRSDLLLLELYQAITLTLPKGGFSYHYSHDVPPKIWERDRRDPPPRKIGGRRIDGRFDLATNDSILEIVDQVSREKKTSGTCLILDCFPTYGFTFHKGSLARCTPKYVGLVAEILSTGLSATGEASVGTGLGLLSQSQSIPWFAKLNLGLRLRLLALVDSRLAEEYAREKPGEKIARKNVQPTELKKLLNDITAEVLNAGLRPKVDSLVSEIVNVDDKVTACCRAIMGDGSTCEARESGLTPVITEVFRDLRTDHGKEVVWIEMEDFTDVPALVHYILHILSLRLGVFQLEHAVLLPVRFTEMRAELLRNSTTDKSGTNLEHPLKKIWKDVIEAASAYLGLADLSKYVFCFYGRNVPGSCAGWKAAGRKWEKKEYSELRAVLEIFCGKGMNVLYVPLTTERIETNDDINLRAIVGSDLERSKLKKYDLFIGNRAADVCFQLNKKRGNSPPPWRTVFVATGRLERREPRKNQKKRPASVTDALEKLGDKIFKAKSGRANQVRLLYTVSLFRCSRPPSVFLSDPVYKSRYQFNAHGLDSDWAKKQDVSKWLEEYRELELMWRKPGGNSWMYRDGLLGLRLILEEGHERAPQGSKWPDVLSDWKDRGGLRSVKSRTHYYIARWYFRAFCSSNHAVPLLEALYHLYQSVLSLECARPENSRLDLDLYRYQRLVRSLTEWIKVLRLARNSLPFWFNRPAIERWLSPVARKTVMKGVRCAQTQVLKKPKGGKDLRDFKLRQIYLKGLAGELEFEFERCYLAFQRKLSLSEDVLPRLGPNSPREIESIEIPKVDLFANSVKWSPAHLWPQGSQLAIGADLARRILRALRKKMVQVETCFLRPKRLRSRA